MIPGILKYKPHIKINEKHHLTISGVDIVELAERFPTPFYVIDEQRIRQRYREFYNAFSKHYDKNKIKIKYACKANSSLSVLRILKSEGAGIDAISPGEIFLALKAGFKPEDIIYTGVNRSHEDLEYGYEKGVIINLDSLCEAEILKQICEENRKVGKRKTGAEVKISFRYNPEIMPETHKKLSTGLRESKFGLHESEIIKAYKLAKKHFSITGLHMHIGSQITRIEPFLEACEKLMDLAGKLKKNLGIEPEFIDFGGGVGIVYKEGQESININELAEKMISIIERKIEEHKLSNAPELFFEPGRYIVGDAGMLVAKVTCIKTTPYKKFVGIDAGFNTLIRPAMYDAYHEIIIANKADFEPKESFDVAGNVCESGDIFGGKRDLPEPEIGDIVAILDAGAYCMSMASEYNARPLPGEIVVNRANYKISRDRGKFEDLLRNQKRGDRE